MSVCFLFASFAIKSLIKQLFQRKVKFYARADLLVLLYGEREKNNSVTNAFFIHFYKSKARTNFIIV